MMLVVEAWRMLDSCRSIGTAIGPIPTTAVWQWCERRKLDDDLTDAIATAINYLDAERTKRAAQKQRTTPSKPASKKR